MRLIAFLLSGSAVVDVAVVLTPKEQVRVSCKEAKEEVAKNEESNKRCFDQGLGFGVKHEESNKRCFDQGLGFGV